MEIGEISSKFMQKNVWKPEDIGSASLTSCLWKNERRVSVSTDLLYATNDSRAMVSCSAATELIVAVNQRPDLTLSVNRLST